MKVIVLCDHKFLGTGLELKEGEILKAEKATNQPRYKKEGKIFVLTSDKYWTPVIRLIDGEVARIQTVTIKEKLK